MNQTVTKIIAFILIASVVVELSSAAPLTKDQSSTEIPKNQKNPHRKKFGLKHLKNGGNEHITREQRKLFKGVNPKLWRNSCNYDNAENSSDNDRPVSMYQQNMKVEVGIIKEIFRSLKSINITELENWEEFYNSSFDFLPIKPKGMAFEWHKQTQIYVASFAVLHNISKRYENRDEENQKITMELKSIFEESQTLLCAIESFINGTLNKNSPNLMEWFRKDEIMEIVKIPEPEASGGQSVGEKISYVMVVGRFQQYINRLMARVERFDLEKNVTKLEKKGGLGRSRKLGGKHKNRRNRRKNQKRRSTTRNLRKPTFIVTTPKASENSKNQLKIQKAPEQKKKIRINTSLRN